jgi:hypothetical protein
MVVTMHRCKRISSRPASATSGRGMRIRQDIFYGEPLSLLLVAYS